MALDVANFLPLVRKNLDYTGYLKKNYRKFSKDLLWREKIKTQSRLI